MAKSSNVQQSIKRIGVNKTNARIVAVTAISAFLVIFFLVGAFSLVGQLTYQNRIITAKKQAVSQLKQNLSARDSLVGSYKSFASSSQNFIGGSVSGTGAQDGSNAKLVLDALPPTYDFPALTTSLEKLASDQKVSIQNLTGVDDSLAQSDAKTVSVQPVQIPFEIKVSGTYDQVKSFVDNLDRSIRPIQVQKLDISNDQAGVSADVTAVSYYQPAKNLNIGTKVVK